MKRTNPLKRREVPKVGLHSPVKEKTPQRAPETPHVDPVYWRKGERLWIKVKPVILPVSAIFVSLIVQPKRTIGAMLTWLQERLGEPSTYKGLTALAGAVGYQIDPEGFTVIVAVVLAVIGAIDFFQDDKKLVKKNVDAAEGE